MVTQLVYLTTSEVAKRAGVDSSTVRNWVATHKLSAAVTTPGGHHRFDPKAPDLVAIIGETESADSEAVAS